MYNINLSKKDKNKKIEEALDMVNLKEYRKKRVGKLSGGQQQRVFIAKALVSSPKIIMLDEPITGVDAHNANSICCLLGKLNVENKTTIIMVTHDHNSLKNHYNKLITIDSNLQVNVEEFKNIRGVNTDNVSI
jgi:zinc transport system ATP-binding protein